MLRTSFFAGDAFQEKPGGRCAHLVTGLMDGRKGGVGEHAQFEVVKTDEGDVFGAAQAHFADREQRAQGDHVVRREDCPASAAQGAAA